jgi:hypothetical protein
VMAGIEGTNTPINARKRVETRYDDCGEAVEGKVSTPPGT